MQVEDRGDVQAHLLAHELTTELDTGKQELGDKANRQANEHFPHDHQSQMSKPLWYHYVLRLDERIQPHAEHQNEQNFDLRWDVA